MADGEQVAGSTGPRPWGAERISAVSESPAAKFFLAGLLTLGLTIPLLMVFVLTEDRSMRRDDVARTVSRDWGAAQTVAGPVLVIPYLARTGRDPDPGKRRYLAVLPDVLSVEADAEAETRSIAVYDVPVYAATVIATGRFDAVEAEAFGEDALSILWDSAYLAVVVSDLSGLEEAKLDVAGSPLEIRPRRAPESGPRTSNVGTSGVHAPLPGGAAAGGFSFRLDLRLRGTDALRFAPVGRQSTVTIQSDWAHPNFTVGMLPSERSVSSEGFVATWRVPYLARSLPQISELQNRTWTRLNAELVGVGLVDPVDLYALVERALKYGVMFIGVTFLIVFVLEVFSAARIHIVQYCLVGLVLIMFFVLVLALAERIGFATAYLIASAVTAGVVAVFVGLALGSRLKALVTAALLSVSFALLYAILTLEDLALLAGAIVGFLAVSGVLFATRGINWSGTGAGSRAKAA